MKETINITVDERPKVVPMYQKEVARLYDCEYNLILLKAYLKNTGYDFTGYNEFTKLTTKLEDEEEQ